MQVKIYSTPTCGHCRQAKEYFSHKGIVYEEIDVARDRVMADEMVKLSGQMSVPVIVIDGRIIVGFDESKIEGQLNESK